MASQQYTKERQGMSLPVTHRYATMEPNSFRETISETWVASKAIIDTVSDQVEAQSITPVQGAHVVSAITGSLFGFTEFQRELRPADLALLSWQGNGSSQGR